VPSLPVSRPVALALVSALVALLVVAGQRLSQVGAARAPDVVAPVEPVADASKPATQPALVVHVVGAVRRPGLFRLREGARVADAVARAGGATGKAYLAGLNLAAPLVDGIQVVVPTEAAAGIGGAGQSAGGGLPAPPGASGALGPKMSLATATAEELDELPGVGPVTAQTIIDYRTEHGPFRSVDDLDAVPGIGPTRVEQLRELVTP
jgi:competence protein ComEA